MKKERKVIDAHLHIFGHCEFGDRLAHGIGDEPTQEYLTEKYYGRLGIEKGIVMGNGPLEEQGKNLGEYFYYSAGLDEKDSWLKLEEIESHLQRKRCVGVKLYPGYYELYPNDKSLYPIYKMTEEYGKVLSVHTGMVAGNGGHLKYCRPIHLDDIATDFPGLKIVMCHFGNPFLQEAAAVLEKNPNMYADLSGLIEGAFETETFIKDQSGYLEILKSWMHYVSDYAKFIYGTDWPAVNCFEYREFIKRLVPEQYHEKVFYENAVRVYGLEMKYYEDKSDRKMELKLLSLSEDDKLIRECMEQASAFYGCLGKMGVTEILCDRKKAQELGADCQITGIFTGGELTAFACAFEYTGLKRNGRKWLNPGDKEWRQIETLGTNVVVIPLLVGKEKVGRLIELLREQYRDSHLLFRISGEQSEKFQEDLAVVSEKNLKSHRYDAAGENVWLFHFAPQIRMEDTYFEEEILLILPGQEVLLEMGIEEAEVTMVKLTGYEIVRSEKGSAFFRKPGAACEGVLLQCDYEQLLRYQRFINLTNYEEHFEQTDRGKALIYSEKYQSDSSLLWNDLLREMVKTRKAEWSIVPDSYIMYPVTYKEQDRLLECACYDNQEIGNYMHYMDIRLQCETGVPFGKDGIDLMERYKNRLERIPLGRLRVRITLEMILDILDHEDQPVGCDAEAEAVLSIDRLSHIGVLTLVSLSTPFLLSHFLDNIVRNQLMVIEENGEAVNLYAYMQEKWGLNASGTPKSYEMIPKEKNCLNKKQLGAVLLSETIYEEGEDFGEFTDAEILKLTNSETGMGQYSRAFVVAHTNVLLDFEKDLRGTIQARMYNAAFTCFYVELLMFEEAALTCFNKELIDLMAEVMRIEPTEFLTRARTITNRYLNTVDFWNVSVNYPSSQKSLQMIRKSFLIDDLKEKMEYNQKQVGNIFDINREIVDRQEAKEEKERDDQSNTALTILSVLCFFSAMIDGNDYLSTLDWLIPAGVLDIILKGVFPITMIGILLYVLKKLYGRSK